MGKFIIVRERPVPSCTVQRVLWDSDNSKWNYEYHATLPNTIDIDSEGNFSSELFVYGHIQQLHLVDKVTKNSVNIKVNSVKEIEHLIDLQYKADIDYRKKWMKSNPDYYDHLYTCEYTNETQESKYSHIIFVKEQHDDTTVFVVAPEKGVR